ncbi:GNAT family N-acetyltransferase [Deinococcus sp. UYEF24]
MTPLLIRAATPADLPALVDLWNAATPDTPTTLEIQEFRERDRNPELAFGRLLAEQHGRVCGVATFAQPEWSSDEDQLRVIVTVHPQTRNQGVGRALYAALESAMRPQRPARLVSLVREDRPDALHFAGSRGFAEVAREQDSELTLVHLDRSRREASMQRALEGGYELLTFEQYAQRVGDDLAWTRLHALDIDAARDEPTPPGEAVTVPPLERYREKYDGDPTFDPSLWFVAAQFMGGQFVGGQAGGLAALSQLSVSSAPGRMQTGFTAVGREHRGRSLAWALKYLALEEATRRGALTVRTTNDERNRPMLHINVALGFVPLPAWLTVRCTPDWGAAEA